MIKWFRKLRKKYFPTPWEIMDRIGFDVVTNNNKFVEFRRQSPFYSEPGYLHIVTIKRSANGEIVVRSELDYYMIDRYGVNEQRQHALDAPTLACLNQIIKEKGWVGNGD